VRGIAKVWGEYMGRKFKLLRLSFGNCCQHCGTKENLEFAHKEPTGLDGKGRGSYARFKDICRNKDKYLLLCKDCHLKYDNGGKANG